tara:strand:+ start:1712 stop:2374 length:663 start_codon:yes stop_codon:yes gene_type:complete
MSNIYLKMNNVMAGCKPIIKDQAKGIPYKVLPWNKVSDMVKDLLVKEKITFIPQIRETIANGNMTITTVDGEFINAENPEEKITINGFTGYGVDSSDKGPGKAYSYAIKYLFIKTFCMQIGDDEDSEKSNPQAKPINKIVKVTDKVVDLASKKQDDIIVAMQRIIKNGESTLQERQEDLSTYFFNQESIIKTLTPAQQKQLTDIFDSYNRQIKEKIKGAK